MKDKSPAEDTSFYEQVSKDVNGSHGGKNYSQQRKFQRASEHIITQRTLRGWHWFSTSSSVELEIRELSKLVDELLDVYKEYFDTVLEREQWSASNALSDFKRIAEEVLHRDEEQYNWTRIAMLLALATRLSQHFYKKGASSDFIKQFSRDVGSCIESRAGTWVQSNHRWDALKPRTRSPESNDKIYKCLFGAGALALGFVTTVVNFSMSTPVFISRLRS